MPKKPPKPTDREAAPRFKKKSKAATTRARRHQPLAMFGLMAVLTEMDRSDHRTAAIVATAMIDNNLALALQARLRPLSDPEQGRLFEHIAGPLSSLHGKIEIGYALKLFGHVARDDLHRVRTIRNHFAHDLSVRDFDHEEVAPLCDALYAPRFLAKATGTAEVTDRRERFLSTASNLATRFGHEAQHVSRPPDALYRFEPDY